MQHLHLADSIGIDFHKTGFAPYVSSAILTRSAADMQRLVRDDETMPYLFQSGNHHPGKFTLETSRSASGPMAAYANLRLFGKDGLRSLLGHLVSMAEELREELDGHASATVLNRENHGPVTLFRVYPEGVDTFVIPERERTDPEFETEMLRNNEYNRRVFQLIHDDALQGEGSVLSLTDNYRQTEYGQPMVALKSYIMSPFTTESDVRAVLESIWKARSQLADEFRSS
jgi:glutamate/tyrosine decarboxylase-like PLP-dependent enzyme